MAEAGMTAHIHRNNPTVTTMRTATNHHQPAAGCGSPVLRVFAPPNISFRFIEIISKHNCETKRKGKREEKKKPKEDRSRFCVVRLKRDLNDFELRPRHTEASQHDVLQTTAALTINLDQLSSTEQTRKEMAEIVPDARFEDADEDEQTKAQVSTVAVAANYGTHATGTPTPPAMIDVAPSSLASQLIN
jgi:hypothetical protein